MPKKKAGYEDALGSIFDFIFKESKTRPAKYKPPKYTGKNNSSTLAGAFAEIASKPAMYFSNAASGTLNSALFGQTLVDFSVDKPDAGKTPGSDEERGRFRVRTSDVGKFLSNPNKYWQDVFNNAKTEGAYAKYVGLGKVMDGAMVALWAAQNKLPVGTAMDLGNAAGMEVTNPMAQKAEKMLAQNIAYDAFSKQDAAKIINALDNSAQTNYTKDSLKKILSKDFSGATLDNYANQLYGLYHGTRVSGITDEPNKYFASGVIQKSTSKIWEKQEADDVSAIIKSAGLTNYTKDDLKKVLAQKYSGAELDRYTEQLFDATQGDKKFALNRGGVLGNNYAGGYSPGRYLTEGKLNSFGFREITAENLRKKANLIDLTSAKTPIERTQLLEQRKTLLESAALMETISRAKFSYQPKFPDFDNTIKDIQSQINNLTARGAKLSPQDQAFRNGLMTLQKTIESAQQEYADKTGKKVGLFTIATGIDKYDANSVKKAMGAEIQYERLRVERLIAQLQGKTNQTSFDQTTLNSLLEQRGFLELKEKALRTLPLTDFRYNINNWTSAYSSVKSVMVDGKNIGSIIDGSFYRDEGFFKSSVMGGINYMRNGKVMSSYGAMFYKDTGTAWQQMTYLYYLTPGVLVSSFVNGDIPAFLVYNSRRIFLSSLNDPNKIQALLNSPIGAQFKNFLDKGKIKDSLDNDPKKFQELLDLLKKSSDPNIVKLAGRTESVMKVGGELAYRLSAFKGISDKVGGWIKTFDAKVGAKFRQALADRVLKKLLDNAAWQSAVEQFVANNIGALQVVRVFVQELVATTLEALGVSLGGPVGAALAWVISEAATSVAFEIGKGIMQIVSVIVILMLALIAFIFFFSTNVLFHNPVASTQSYRYVIPGSEIQCTNYDPDSLNYVDTSGDGTQFPPVNSTCPFVFSPQTCTQGDGPTSSAYHQLVHAMDVGTNGIPQGQDVWYAPTDGKVTKFNPSNTCSDGSNYGGVLEFTDTSGIVYVLMHVRLVAPEGGKISKGTAVAVSMHDLIPGYCWTGPHFHTEVKVNGAHVQAEDWYKNKLKCPISACSQ